jgi:hypothetical protein
MKDEMHSTSSISFANIISNPPQHLFHAINVSNRLVEEKVKGRDPVVTAVASFH